MTPSRRRPSRCRLERHDERRHPIYKHRAPTLGRGHMRAARQFIAATRVSKVDRDGNLRCRSRGFLWAIIAAVAAAAPATGALLFASGIFAQPASDALGEVLVGKAALGDWRTDAPLVRRKITELPPPYATRSVSNPPRVIAKPASASPQVPPGFRAELFASGLRDPRVIRIAPN